MTRQTTPDEQFARFIEDYRDAKGNLKYDQAVSETTALLATWCLLNVTRITSQSGLRHSQPFLILTIFPPQSGHSNANVSPPGLENQSTKTPVEVASA